MKTNNSKKIIVNQINGPATGLKRIFQFNMVIIMFLIMAGCNLPGQQLNGPTNDLVGSMVAVTLTAMSSTGEINKTQVFTQSETLRPLGTDATLSSETPTFTPSSSTGKVTGLVCFTEITSTNLDIYFQNIADNKVVQLPVTVNNYQVTYAQELNPGTYIAYAWNTDFSIGGTYSACGLDSKCSDASPKPFVVTAGQTLAKIDICDWSHGPFDVPYPPGFEAASEFGTISGSIYGYPYGGLPQLTVVAFNKSTGYWYWVGTAVGQSYFSMLDIPAGTYQVVAYDPSGHAGGSSANIVVVGGQTANVDINSWSGTYPANPVK
jgi:hypothetical protein